MEKDPRSSTRTRRTLLERLGKTQSDGAWNQFFEIYEPLILRVVKEAARRRFTGITDEDTKDITQETLLTLWKRISSGKFRYEGRFRGFVIKTAYWRIKDHLKKKRKQPPAATPRPDKNPSSTATIERIPAPTPNELDEIVPPEKWQAWLLQTAIKQVKLRLRNPMQFQIYEEHVINGHPVRKVAELLGVNTAQVYLAKLRITRMIAAEVKRLERGGV